MTEKRERRVTDTFPAELRSFWSLCIVSLVLGALALAFGLWSIVDAVLAMAGGGSFGVYRLVQAFAGWAAAVIGFRWVLSTAGILKGVSGILRDYQALEGKAGGEGREDSTPETGGAASPGAVEALVFRMLAHYKADWKTWWKMRLIAAAGGWIFICLGVLRIIDGYPAWQSGGMPYLPFSTGVVSIALGVAAILVSSRFRSTAWTWERRLIDAGQGEEILQDAGEKGSS